MLRGNQHGGHEYDAGHPALPCPRAPSSKVTPLLTNASERSLSKRQEWFSWNSCQDSNVNLDAVPFLYFFRWVVEWQNTKQLQKAVKLVEWSRVEFYVWSRKFRAILSNETAFLVSGSQKLWHLSYLNMQSFLKQILYEGTTIIGARFLWDAQYK